MPERKILFVDRDGTLVEEPDDEQVDRLDKIRLVPDVIPAMLRLKSAGYEFVMVTNQDGRGTPSFPEEDFRLTQDFIVDLFASQGITFSAIHVDATFPEDGADTRKPGLGMVRDYLKPGALDRERSAVVGDRETDLQLAENMGLRGFLVRSQIKELDARMHDQRVDSAAPSLLTTQNSQRDLTWPSIASALLDADRVGVVERTTAETRIRVRVALEETAVNVSTGIGFFDHMLEQIAVHGGFGLTLACEGDLDVDEHHTIEDCGLALGAAIAKALGDRRGIGRYGFVLPMDESRATVAVDLGGRPYCIFEADFPRETVGGFPTEMVGHFFQAVSQTLGAAIHIEVRGDNTHHMIEAAFKGFARALRPALKRESETMPSSKGVLT